ncbi:ABC transporter permease [Actinomadura alba]|uniref:ABC transporter permease n=2 Tax=Actinomadura alba TaxID=406431 RepID=A0ABR7LX57_9ACTN|nr:ABC transporter permease [Actinomadura alba]
MELCSRLGVLPRDWFPPVTSMYAELFRLIVEQPLWVEIGRTLRAWAVGIGLAALLAVPCGVLLGSIPLAYRMARIVIEFCRPIPSVALIPLAVLVYGTGLEMKVFLITFATFWPLLFQTIYGVQDVDPVARDTARAYGLGPSARFWVITIPSAAPYIATGLRIAAAIGLVLGVTSELVGGAPGLGRAIAVAQSAGNVTLMYALIITTGLLGLTLNSAFAAVERKALRWHPAQRQEVAR